MHQGDKLWPEGYNCSDLVAHWWKVYGEGQDAQTPTFCRKKWASLIADDDDGSKAQNIVAHGSAHSVKMMSNTYVLNRAKIMAQSAKATTRVVMGDPVPFPLPHEVSRDRKIERLMVLFPDYRCRAKKACPPTLKIHQKYNFDR